MSDVSFREVQLDSDDYRAALRLRAAVLREPLGLSFTAEELTDEPRCFHLVAVLDDAIVGTLLFKPLDATTVKMRQVAVQPGIQRGGIGRGLIAFAEEFARERSFKRVIAHARGTAVGFYDRLGYTTEGEPFLEQTIPHMLVTKSLD